MSIELIDMAFISEKILYNRNKDRSSDLGYLSLNKNEILFEFVKDKRVLKLQISELQNILKKSKHGHDYVTIFIYPGKKYSFELIKKKFNRFISSKRETNRFYNLLFRFKFKEIAKKCKEKYQFADYLKGYEFKNYKSKFCIDCAESIRNDANFCYQCGKTIKILENLQEIDNDLKNNDVDERENKEDIKINGYKKLRDDTEKLRKLIEISPLIRLDDLRKYLNLDFPDFYEKIIKWSKDFGLIIDGDYLITNSDSLKNFMSTLNRQYLIKKLVKKKRNSHEKKICEYCNNLIELKVKICPYCGYVKPDININKFL